MAVGTRANLLVSSAGRRGELVKLLRGELKVAGLEGDVRCVDRSPHTAAGWLADGLDLVPSIDDEDFIPAVLDVCRRHDIRHVIPTLDPELPVYSAVKSRFEDEGISVWVSAPETIAIAQDKRRTAQWLRESGLPGVQQWDLENFDLPEPFDVIAKPARGSSSIGLRRVSSATELASVDRDLDYVIERVAPGEEYTVDVLVSRDGSVQATVPRRRLETRAGEVSKGLTVAAEDIEWLAAKAVGQLPGAFGVLNVQIFKDAETGQMNVIEINARFGGGFPLTWQSGAHMPAWLLQEAAGLPTSASLRWQPNLLMLRYDAAVFRAVGSDGV